MTESTHGSSDRLFCYEGTRVQLNPPLQVTHNRNKTITYSHRNVIKSIPVTQSIKQEFSKVTLTTQPEHVLVNPIPRQDSVHPISQEFSRKNHEETFCVMDLL